MKRIQIIFALFLLFTQKVKTVEKQKNPKNHFCICINGQERFFPAEKYEIADKLLKLSQKIYFFTPVSIEDISLHIEIDEDLNELNVKIVKEKNGYPEFICDILNIAKEIDKMELPLKHLVQDRSIQGLEEMLWDILFKTQKINYNHLMFLLEHLIHLTDERFTVFSKYFRDSLIIEDSNPIAKPIDSIAYNDLNNPFLLLKSNLTGERGFAQILGYLNYARGLQLCFVILCMPEIIKRDRESIDKIMNLNYKHETETLENKEIELNESDLVTKEIKKLRMKTHYMVDGLNPIILFSGELVLLPYNTTKNPLLKHSLNYLLCGDTTNELNN